MMFLWDADGVLFHTFLPDGRFAWSAHIEQDLGLDNRACDSIFQSFDDVILGRVDMRAHVEQALARVQSTVTADAFMAYWLDRDSRINESVARYMDSVPSCIASNQPKPRAAKFRQWFQGRARHVFASSEMGVQKPDAAYFIMIEGHLNMPPDQLILIDDYEPNVAAARARGWTAHHFQNGTALDAFMQPYL